ncbi:MAG: HupE/UreJ family protein [Deltaproteobacteria bacterium]|nr:MAG: HupE/UreJ family protein [Deltaproteobacteria bacterium]
MTRMGLGLLLLGILASVPSAEVRAHPLAPALLDIRESEAGRADVSWKTSLLRVPGSNVQPVLPSSCRAITSPTLIEGTNSMTTRWSVSCEPRSLVGQRIGVEGLARAKIDALLRISLADGRVVLRVLRASEPFVTVPERDGHFDITRAYLGLGVEHILLGLDHLLFVFGLLLLVGGVRLLTQTLTAFTLGHSVTLALAILGFVNFSVRPLEMAIALSVFVLAVELARGETAQPTLMRRFPWVMALLFGLLHGLGFAGALREVGLPAAEIPLALLSFNLGIELGQLLFVFAILALRWLLRVRLSPLPTWTEQLPVYAMGSLAAFWCFERAAALLP